MEILCTAFSIFRRTYCNIRQNRRKEHQFRSCNCHQDHRNTAAYMGHSGAGRHLGELRDIGRHTWLFLILSGLATGLSWLFYFKALQTGDVSRVAPIDKLSVVMTICLSFLFLKEPVSPRVILGAVLITAGSIIMIVK